MLKSIVGNFENHEVKKLLIKHFIELKSVSQEGSTHVLDIDGLKDSSIKFFSLWADNKLMGCGALKFLDKEHGEFKSIRIVDKLRNKGNGAKIVNHLINEAKKLNKEIHETIYFAAMEASMEVAMIDGPYQTYEGSPVSKGIFQFDMWGVTPDSGRWNWTELKQKVKKNGVRNSLLVAPMPTASTSQILGNNECFEPFTSNIYTRRVLSGEFVVVNKHLMKDLIELGLWNDEMKNKLIAANGSIQNIPEIPKEIKELYLTVWEIKQKDLIDMAADRGAYIDQSQSFNVHMQNPNFGKKV